MNNLFRHFFFCGMYSCSHIHTEDLPTCGNTVGCPSLL